MCVGVFVRIIICQWAITRLFPLSFQPHIVLCRGWLYSDYTCIDYILRDVSGEDPDQSALPMQSGLDPRRSYLFNHRTVVLSSIINGTIYIYKVQ